MKHLLIMHMNSALWASLTDQEQNEVRPVVHAIGRRAARP
jgi:hypothetical protein